MALQGRVPTEKELLDTFAEPANWECIVRNAEEGALWVWRGPFIPPYELIELARKKRDDKGL